MHKYDAAEEWGWAQQLLPVSADGQATIARQGAPHVQVAKHMEDHENKRRNLEQKGQAQSKTRFSPMAAPGPAGMRGEHLHQLMGVRNQQARRKLHRVMNTLLQHAENGSLPDTLR